MDLNLWDSSHTFGFNCSIVIAIQEIEQKLKSKIQEKEEAEKKRDELRNEIREQEVLCKPLKEDILSLGKCLKSDLSEKEREEIKVQIYELQEKLQLRYYNLLLKEEMIQQTITWLFYKIEYLKKDIENMRKSSDTILTYVHKIRCLEFLTKEQRLWLMRAVMTEADNRGRVVYAIPGSFGETILEKLKKVLGLTINMDRYDSNFTIFTLYPKTTYSSRKPLILKTEITSPGNVFTDDDFFSQPPMKLWICINDNDRDYAELQQRIVPSEVLDGKLYEYDKPKDIFFFFPNKDFKKRSVVADAKDCGCFAIPIIYNDPLLNRPTGYDVLTALVKAGAVPPGDSKIYVSYENSEEETLVVGHRSILRIWTILNKN